MSTEQEETFQHNKKKEQTEDGIEKKCSINQQKPEPEKMNKVPEKQEHRADRESNMDIKRKEGTYHSLYDQTSIRKTAA